MLNFARCSLLALALASFGCVSGASPDSSSAGAASTGNPNGGSQPSGGSGSMGSAGTGVIPGSGAGGVTGAGGDGSRVGGGSLPGGGASGAFASGGSPAAIVVDPNDVVSDAPLSMLKPAFMSATHPLKPHAVFGGHAAPLPTDAFWENMVLDSGDWLTNAFPYHVNAQAAGVALSRPEMLTTSDKFCYESAPIAVVLGASEAFTSHTVASWDPLSVTLKYSAASGSMSAPIVYGMAYGTGLYDGVTPKISVPVGLGSVNGVAAGSAQGIRFDLALNNGQKWILYASESASVTWSSNALTFAAPLKGWVRVALQTTAVTAAVLDQHASAIPTGGALRLSATGDTGVVEFSWTKQGTGDILAFALPHQLDHLAEPNLVTTGFASVRGQIRGVSGDLWQLQYPLSPALRAAPRAVDPAHKDAIVAALNGDKGAQPNAGDSYDFGKQVGRAAQLLLIAEAIGEKASADQLRGAIESSLGQWLDGGGPDALRYDETYGGVVTSKGLGGSGNDYGNGWYNDHHFHYGYFIYAAGAVAKGDPTWAAKYKEPVLALIRDIANPSATDPYFTQ
ncbi:MAG TPA: glycosyl hydrolase, partial [Polyangiaceae bacterium]|nr:glycosyl hydrolase [Polyangiaceae bacterium]